MKKLFIMVSTICLTFCLSGSVNALEYTIRPPDNPEYAGATSVTPVIPSDRGERSNLDVSKNAALIPPPFGSPTSNLPGSGEPLTPNLTGAGLAVESGSALGGTPSATIPGSTVAQPGGPATAMPSVPAPTPEPITRYTSVTNDLYYENGHLGTLKIPSLHVSVKLYQGTGASALAKGAGHFEETSIWEGNVAIAGHNRGANCCFGEIHTLALGDTVTLTTRLGTRTYAVTSVSKVSETDRSLLTPTGENCVTLYTCVKNQPSYRWCVRAVEST